MGNLSYGSPWQGAVDGVATTFTTYPTIHTTDVAIELVDNLPEPFFVWVAYNAAHRPAHVPPAPLNPGGVVFSDPELDRFHAVITALDLELERLLAAVDPQDTYVVFMTDNGTYGDFLPLTGWEPRAGKGSEYEAGVRVPMVVRGPGVQPGSVTDARVHVTDVFPTLVELAGIDPDSFSVTTAGHWDDVRAGAVEPWMAAWTGAADPVVLDGASFVPQLVDPLLPMPRRYLWFERFVPNVAPNEEWRAVSDGDFKLRYRDNVSPPIETLYDLRGRHDDGPDLLGAGVLDPEQQEAYDRLADVMQLHLDELAIVPP